MKKFLLLASVCSLSFAAPVFAQEDGVQEDSAPLTKESAENMTEEELQAAIAAAVAAAFSPQAGDEEDVSDHGAPEGHEASPPLRAEARDEPMTETTKEPEHSDSAASAHWGYMGAQAASQWGALDKAYEACTAGMRQSPVNIHEFMRDDGMGDIALSYSAAPLMVVNNGHTIQVNYPEGSTAAVGDKAFALLQYHFHTPSEHYIDGAPFPMEVHFVHKNDAGELGVFGVMMKLGAENVTIQNIWKNAPAEKAENMVDNVVLNAADLFPADKAYYKYSGSLTTPPCSEGVHWHVLKNPIEISQDQLKAFQTLFPINARPVQGMHDRIVTGK